MKKIIFILICIFSFHCLAKGMNREFYDAVRKGNLALVEKMVSADPSLINKKDEDCTPLNWAAEAGQLEMVKYLINKGADVNSRNNIKDTPLKRACSMMTEKKEQAVVYYTIAKLLIEHGADVNAKCGISAWGGFDLNQTPLHSAAENGNFEMVKLLVEHGADVNAMNYEGATPLRTAIVWGHNKDIIKYLIFNGSDVNIKDKTEGNSIFLEFLMRWKDLEIAKMILEHGANINEPDNKGRTALHHVVSWKNNKETVKFLIANGTALKAKTNLWQTPLDIAKEKRNKEIIELLEKAESQAQGKK